MSDNLILITNPSAWIRKKRKPSYSRELPGIKVPRSSRTFLSPLVHYCNTSLPRAESYNASVHIYRATRGHATVIRYVRAVVITLEADYRSGTEDASRITWYFARVPLSPLRHPRRLCLLANLLSLPLLPCLFSLASFSWFRSDPPLT